MITKKRTAQIQIQLTGYNQTRLLNALIREQVQFFDLKKQSASSMSLWVKKSDSKKALAIFDNLCYNHTTITKELSQSIIEWGIKRIGALIGAIVVVAVFVLSNNFVWRIEVSGLDTVAYNTVQNILYAKNIKTGRLVSSLDRQGTKQELLQLDSVVDATLHMRGTTLVITIFENFPQLPIPPSHPTAIVSQQDAIVTKVIATEGTAVVAPGDKVLKGQDLILPVVYDTNGVVLKEVQPQGAVYGTVTFSDSRFFVLHSKILQQTGRKRQYSDLDIFGLKLQKQQELYPLYEKHTTQRFLFGKSLLPIKTKITTIRELELVDIEYTVEELKDKYTREMEGMLDLKHGTVVKDKVIDLREVAGGYRLDLFVTAEMKIN